jgi:hypothetical protein
MLLVSGTWILYLVYERDSLSIDKKTGISETNYSSMGLVGESVSYK